MRLRLQDAGTADLSMLQVSLQEATKRKVRVPTKWYSAEIAAWSQDMPPALVVSFSSSQIAHRRTLIGQLSEVLDRGENVGL